MFVLSPSVHLHGDNVVDPSKKWPGIMDGTLLMALENIPVSQMIITLKMAGSLFNISFVRNQMNFMIFVVMPDVLQEAFSIKVTG
jgi:hypothetical protein